MDSTRSPVLAAFLDFAWTSDGSRREFLAAHPELLTDQAQQVIDDYFATSRDALTERSAARERLGRAFLRRARESSLETAVAEFVLPTEDVHRAFMTLVRAQTMAEALGTMAANPCLSESPFVRNAYHCVRAVIGVDAERLRDVDAAWDLVTGFCQPPDHRIG